MRIKQILPYKEQGDGKLKNSPALAVGACSTDNFNNMIPVIVCARWDLSDVYSMLNLPQPHLDDVPGFLFGQAV
jgi:hypothetical protein